MKVRVNGTYVYDPVMLDVVDGRTSLRKGDMVKVVNLPGCPPANTMGHCHVADPETGKFIGLVCCNSLVKVTSDRARAIIAELKAQYSEHVSASGGTQGIFLRKAQEVL